MPIRTTRRSSVLSLAVCLSAAFALPGVRATSAAPIYVFGNSSQYGSIDSVTGAYTSIGRLTDSFTNASIPLSGFAFGADNNLYGVTGIDGPGESGEGNYLWRFNPATGVSSDRRDLSVSFVTLARRPGDGRLFGYANDSDGVGQLYSLALGTFAPTLIGSTGIATTFGALTFDSADRLYLAHSFTGDIYRVDTATGQANFFTGTGVLGISGMAVADNTLYTFSTDARARHGVNLSTGAATFLGTYNIGGNSGEDLIYGAAIAPPVPVTIPEPAAGTLFGLAGLIGTGFLAKRKN